MLPMASTTRLETLRIPTKRRGLAERCKRVVARGSEEVLSLEKLGSRKYLGKRFCYYEGLRICYSARERRCGSTRVQSHPDRGFGQLDRLPDWVFSY